MWDIIVRKLINIYNKLIRQLYSDLILLMFEIDIEKLAFDKCLMHFSDEILQKQVEITNIELDFMKTFEGNIYFFDNHPKLVKFVSAVLEDLNKILKDMEYHFLQLKMDFVYNLFEKIFKLTIHGYKVLSEIFLQRYKDEKCTKKLGINNDKEYNSKPSQQKVIVKTKSEEKRDYYRKMEFFTFIISELEKRDHQINNQLQEYLKNIKLQKQIVKKMSPSNTVNKITQIQGDLNQVIDKSYMMFESMFKIRHEQVKKIFSGIQKPKQMEKIFNEQIKSRLKCSFLAGIQKVVEFFEDRIKRKQFSTIKRKKNPSLHEQSFQTDLQIKKDKEEEFQKKIQELNLEIEELKKQCQSNEKEKINLKKKQASLQKQINSLKRENQSFENLLKQKDLDFEQKKMEYEWEMRKKITALEKANEEVNKFKSEKQIFNNFKKSLKKQTDSDQVQTEMTMQYLEDMQTDYQGFVLRTSRKKTSRKFDFDKSNSSKYSGIRCSLMSIMDKLNDLVETPMESQFYEKEIQQLSNLKQVENLIISWCDYLTKIRQQIITKKKSDEESFQMFNPDLKLKWTKSIEKKNVGVQTKSQHKEEKPPPEPEFKRTISKKENQPKNETVEMRKGRKKTRIPQLINSVGRKENGFMDFLRESGGLKSNRSSKNKKQNQFFNKASFEELNFNESKGKVRSSKVGTYLTSISSRKKDEKQKKIIMEETYDKR